MMRMYMAGAAAAVVGVLAGSYWFVMRGASGDAFAACRTARIAGGAAAIGGPFTLVDETGATVRDTDVITKPSLIYFGYTFCPDVCPLDAGRNADVVDRLTEQGHDIQPVFITIDPARDTPEVLAEFTDYMHPQMIGLTGSDDQVAAAKAAYKTYGAKREGDDPEYYLMDHTTFSYLVLPELGFVEFYRGTAQNGDAAKAEDAMVSSIACFLDIAA